MKKKIALVTALCTALTALIAVSLLFSCKKSAVKTDGGLTYGISGFAPAMGSSGDTIKVYGAGFDGNTKVKFGDADAVIVAVGASVLSVILPETTASSQVIIENGTQKAVASEPFLTVVSVSGQLSTNTTWVSEKRYLLKGDVHVTTGHFLKILPGTVIFGEKLTRASLTIDDGASLRAAGTEAQPIVFTSDQKKGFRFLGDWSGIRLQATSTSSFDTLLYARFEFAGYHPVTEPKGAVMINRPMAIGTFEHVQAAYSNSDGFRLGGAGESRVFMRYLIAFGCAGNDFSFLEHVSAAGQFLVGMKDVLYADALGADGVLDESDKSVDLSNISLVGHNGLGRGAEGVAGSPIYPQGISAVFNIQSVINRPKNENAGRGVHIKGDNLVSLHLYNSLIAASWLCGISIESSASWASLQAGDISGGSFFSGNYVASTPKATARTLAAATSLAVPLYPFTGGGVAAENLGGTSFGFSDPTASAQLANFKTLNPNFDKRISFSTGTGNDGTLAKQDDLGIAALADYTLLGKLNLNLVNGSVLLTSSRPVPTLSDNTSFFDTGVSFVGAAGATKYNLEWANLNPFSTAY